MTATAELTVNDRIRTIMAACPSLLQSDMPVIKLAVLLAGEAHGSPPSPVVQVCEKLAAKVHDLAAQRAALRDQEMAARNELEAQLAKLA